MAKPFQFSLRILLAATAVVGASFGVIVAERSWQIGAATIFMVLAFPTFFVAGLLYGSGWLRAFCAGAAVPAILAANVFAIVGFVDSYGYDWQSSKQLIESFCRPDTRVWLAIFWATIPVFGLMCVFFRWLFLAGNDEASSETPNAADGSGKGGTPKS